MTSFLSKYSTINLAVWKHLQITFSGLIWTQREMNNVLTSLIVGIILFCECSSHKQTQIEIITVVGHSLEEIRVRALQNIISKLEYGLVCNSDLVHERHLHIRLLEWFNFASCPLQDRVLGLILRLSQVWVVLYERVITYNLVSVIIGHICNDQFNLN